VAIHQRILEQLEERGFRSTGPRRAVVEAAARRAGRFTAREIHAELRAQGIGRATVFRTLDVLADLGILERIHSDQLGHTYTLCSERHHHHLICSGCASVQEVVSPSLERVLRTIAQQAGFRLETHLVEILGVCERCQASRAAP
jgi:Fur family transcriptional regulator, ferric uptake regulator